MLSLPSPLPIRGSAPGAANPISFRFSTFPRSPQAHSGSLPGLHSFVGAFFALFGIFRAILSSAEIEFAEKKRIRIRKF